MSGAAIEVIGLARLRTSMKRAGLDLNDLKSLNRQAAEAVAPTARSMTPVGPDVKGHIVSSVRVGATASAGVLRAGTGRGGRFPYGGPLHWGWPSRGIKAQPWLANAAKATEGRWTDVYQNGDEDIIGKIEGA